MWKGLKKRWPGIFENAVYDALIRLGGAVGIGALPTVAMIWIEGTSGIVLFNIFGVTFVSALFLFIFIQLRRLSVGAGQQGQLASLQTRPVQLNANQIIYPYPSKNGVLWEWSATVGMTGPFCPIHRGRLFYLPFMGSKKADFKEDDWLGSNGSFVCPVDDEEFIFIRPSSMQVGNLRTQAKEHFQIEQERKKLSEQ